MRRADHSSRGVLPTVMRRCVRSRKIVNGKAVAHLGLLRQKKKVQYCSLIFNTVNLKYLRTPNHSIMYTAVKSLRQLYTELSSAAGTELPQRNISINARNRLFHDSQSQNNSWNAGKLRGKFNRSALVRGMESLLWKHA